MQYRASSRRRLMQTTPLAALVLVLLANVVGAQPSLPAVEELVQPAEPTAASYRDEVATSHSYAIPALEVGGLLIATNIGARLAGASWASATPSTMWTNLTHAWVYDDDLFSVNQLAHPYGGALLFTATRSSGLGFWTSASYGLVGSLLWETLAETEPPSINDQITTTIAGAFLGEVMHRWGRAVLWGDGRKASFGRRAMAAVINPIGEANHGLFGDRWRLVAPPRLHAFMAVGVNVALGDALDAPFHSELAVSHGLASDPLYEPRVPFDHFDLRVQIDVGAEGATGYLDVRGLIVGTSLGEDRRRAVWGLYGVYDYWDADRVRAGAIGFGPGIAAHASLGTRSFLDVSAALALVPWGAAGGTGDIEGVRDYEHAPGASEVVELKLGTRGLGVARLSARAIQIAGQLVDGGNEAVVLTSAGVMVSVAQHHALGVEITYSAHYASLTDAPDPFDQSAQLRFVYAITSDDLFGGGAR